MNVFNFSSYTIKNLKQNTKHNLAMSHSVMLYNRDALYSFIPKNGCSTMRLSVAIDNGCIDSLEQGHWIHANNSTFNASLSEAIKAKYTFVILRCPFRRLASVFLDKFVAKEVDAWRYRDVLGRKVELDALSFRDFVVSLKKNNVFNCNIHWRKQVDFLLYKEYSDYFCMESFSEIEKTLDEKIGLKIHDARSLTNHGTSHYEMLDSKCFADVSTFDLAVLKKQSKCPSHKAMYDDELVEIVRDIYKDDLLIYIEKFGETRLLFPSSTI